MTTYSFRARDGHGLLITGELDATNPNELKSLLADRGLIPLTATKKTQSFDASFLKNFFQPKIKKEELLVVTRQFYTLFKAGMGMEGVLGTLVRQTTNKRLKEILLRIRASVSAGESLSKAFSHHRAIFGDLYINMLEAGEEAGILESVLQRLSDLLEKEMQLNASVKSATLYPKIVIFVLLAASVVVLKFVMPKFAGFYANYQAALPLPTRIMLGLSNFVENQWYVGAALLVVGVILYRKFAATTRGKIRIGAFQFRVPVFGPLNLKVANSRFSHILSALYRSGLPMNRCLEITGGTIGNEAFSRDIEFLKYEVTQGKLMSDAMAQCHFFSPIIIDATAVGEKTGALDDILEAMANHYDVEVQHTLKNLTTMLEPILLGVLFGMVALFMLAIFMPMWNLNSVVMGQ